MSQKDLMCCCFPNLHTMLLNVLICRVLGASAICFCQPVLLNLWCWFQIPRTEVWPCCLIPGVVYSAEPLHPWIQVAIVSSRSVAWDLVIPKCLDTTLPPRIQVPICALNIFIFRWRLIIQVSRIFIFIAVINVPVTRRLWNYTQVSNRGNVWGIQVAPISCHWIGQSAKMGWKKTKIHIFAEHSHILLLRI